MPRDLIQPLVDDLVSTLGWTPEESQSVIQDPGGRGGGAIPDLVAIAEDAQQWLHDTFLDTSWPACPQHETHPPGWTQPRLPAGPAIPPPSLCAPWCTGTVVAGAGDTARISRQCLAAEGKSVEEMLNIFLQRWQA
ncbi:MAG: hypothetical protein NVSMB32_01070 [Actinomycetota bacterium]